MREASTSARTEEIIQIVTQNANKNAAEVIIEVDNNGTWERVDDLDISSPVTWSTSGKRSKQSNFSLTPTVGMLKFQVFNEDGKFAPGSGTTFENKFDLDTKVRLKAGYRLETLGTEDTESLNLNDVSGVTVKSFFFYTQYNVGGYVELDSSPSDTTPEHFKGIFGYYDAGLYDAGTYSADAYTVHTFDSEGVGFKKATQISVTANNTDGKIYYRSVNSTTELAESFFTNWTYAANTINGTKDVTVDIERRFVQVGILYDGIVWGTQQVSDITITFSPYIEYLYKGVYILDEPEYDDPKAPTVPKVFCNARDVYKKAIETDVNLPDLNANNKTPDELIKYICDQIGITYTATSIVDLSAFGNIVWSGGMEDVVKADKLFELVMAKTATSNYQMYVEYDEDSDDNILFVKAEPSAYLADGVFSYRNYTNIGATKKTSERLLQRITILSDSQLVSAETQLDQQTFSTTGNKTMSWTGSAEYKRVTIDDPDNINISNATFTPTSFNFTIDSISGSIIITVFGNKFSGSIESTVFTGAGLDDMSTAGRYIGGIVNVYKIVIDGTGTPDTFEWFKGGVSQASGVSLSSRNTLDNGIEITWGATTGHTLADQWEFRVSVNEPKYQGEAINLDNMILGKGNTTRVKNPLIISDAESKSLAEAYITKYANPSLEAKGLTWPYLNLLPEINDLMMMWRRFIFTDDLYFVTKISYSWNKAKSPSMSTSFSLDDSGNDYSDVTDFKWDDGVAKWDRGFVWDMGISTALSSPADIDAASTIVYNTDFE